VIDMGSMFQNAKSFKQQLCGVAWVKSKANKMEMFAGSAGSILYAGCTYTFVPGEELKSSVVACLNLSPKGDCPNGPHGPIGEWDVSGVTRMDEIFTDASFFNGDISKWDVSSVTSMKIMFAGANSFNDYLSKWDVSSVVDTSGMFSGAVSFDCDISKWDVSSVTLMNSMFSDTTYFNSDLSKWDMSKVTNMGRMFSGATSFNNDISGWDVSRVTTMTRMFNGAISFNGDISQWDVTFLNGTCRPSPTCMVCLWMRQRSTLTYLSGTYRAWLQWITCFIKVTKGRRRRSSRNCAGLLGSVQQQVSDSCLKARLD
jgi:surface protein